MAELGFECRPSASRAALESESPGGERVLSCCGHGGVESLCLLVVGSNKCSFFFFLLIMEMLQPVTSSYPWMWYQRRNSP